MRNPRADEKLASIRAASTPYELRRGGIELTILDNVYPTSELSELFVEIMDDPVLGIHPQDDVLDYGSGTGFLAIQAALRRAHVVAIDLNRDAITCGQVNARKYGVERMIDFRCGESLSEIKPSERFNAIFAGIPWDDAEPSDLIERSVYDPGFAMRRSLYGGVKTLLKENGRIFMSSSEDHLRKYPDLYSDDRLIFRVVRERRIKGLLHYAVLVEPSSL